MFIFSKLFYNKYSENLLNKKKRKKKENNAVEGLKLKRLIENSINVNMNSISNSTFFPRSNVKDNCMNNC